MAGILGPSFDELVTLACRILPDLKEHVQGNLEMRKTLRKAEYSSFRGCEQVEKLMDDLAGIRTQTYGRMKREGV